MAMDRDERDSRESFEEQYSHQDLRQALEVMQRVQTAKLGWARLEVSLPEALVLHLIRSRQPAAVAELVAGFKETVSLSPDNYKGVRPLNTTQIRELLNALEEAELAVREKTRYRISDKAKAHFAGNYPEPVRKPQPLREPTMYRLFESSGDHDDD